MSTFMATYKRFVPPPSLTGATAGAAGYASHIAYGLRKAAKQPQTATQTNWEEEGGSLTTPAIAPDLSGRSGSSVANGSQ
jgi:hypothetical protein